MNLPLRFDRRLTRKITSSRHRDRLGSNEHKAGENHDVHTLGSNRDTGHSTKRGDERILKTKNNLSNVLGDLSFKRSSFHKSVDDPRLIIDKSTRFYVERTQCQLYLFLDETKK